MDPSVVAAWIAAGASALTLIGTLAAQYFGRRATSQQLDKTLGEQRTRTLNERFATAADQLGSDKPAIRLAGVYAMAGLADDWPENRQTCVDVLCAYLRMPYEPEPGDEAVEAERLAFRASREARHTVIRVITAHLKEGADLSWQGLNFDFTGVVFDGGDFIDAVFSGGRVDFREAEFSGGRVNFVGAKFSGSEVWFHGAKFSGGEVRFVGAEFSGGKIIFGVHTEFSGARVHFIGAKFSGGEVYFGETVSGGRVSFGRAEFSGGHFRFNGRVSSHGTVNFHSAIFSGGDVWLPARFTGGEVGFNDAEFSGGTVSFTQAQFSGSKVDFHDAKFSGGTVDFTDPRVWSVPPEFPWTDTPPAGVKLPHV
jgi:uncharacterized protein YjbI with pentapeptide repeats